MYNCWGSDFVALTLLIPASGLSLVSYEQNQGQMQSWTRGDHNLNFGGPSVSFHVKSF